MEAFAARPTLEQLVEGLATQIANAFASGFLDLGIEDKSKTAGDLRFIEDLVAQVSGRLEHPLPYRSPWGGCSRWRATRRAPATSSPTTSGCSSSWPSRRPSAAASPATVARSSPSVTSSPP